MTCTIISTGAELKLAEHKNDHEPPYTKIKARICFLIGTLSTQGYDSFYVNCEYGIPLWTAEFLAAVKRFRDIKLHIIIPYEDQAVKWEEEHRDRYFIVHQKADDVVLANTQYHPDCYREADQMMIDKSHLLVICGEEGELPGAAQYAATKNIKTCYYPII